MHLLERHALYNLIRMNWLNDPQLSVEPWQVEDYRALPMPALFDRLKHFAIELDRTGFLAYADESASPEELTEHLVGDRNLEAQVEDQIYLLIFELWRRLMTENPSLSIICNELDYQIYLHDRNEPDHALQLQDALGNFALLLNENVDQGLSTQEAFKLIVPYFANDIESFLYDYIFDLIEEDNETYAQDLLDNFAPYLKGNKWFELLYIRLIALSNHKLADKMLVHLMEDYLDEKDIDFNLELLAFLIDTGKSHDFKALVPSTLGIISKEEEFHDFLMLCMDYFHRSDREDQENEIQNFLQKRTKYLPEEPFKIEEKDKNTLMSILHSER
jgi:hypothetical protein